MIRIQGIPTVPAASQAKVRTGRRFPSPMEAPAVEVRLSRYPYSPYPPQVR